MGNKETTAKVVKLRQKIFDKKQSLSQLQQLSWRIKQAEELYPIRSDNPKVLETLLKEFDLIWSEFLYIAKLDLGLTDHVAFPFEDSSPNPAHDE